MHLEAIVLHGKEMGKTAKGFSSETSIICVKKRGKGSFLSRREGFGH